MSPATSVLLVRHYKTGVVQPASYEGRVIVGTEDDLRREFGERRCAEFGFADVPDSPTITISDWLAACRASDPLRPAQ